MVGLAAAELASDCFEDRSDGPVLIDRKNRAKIYLRRIVAFTGATLMGNSYVLDVGTIRFHVRDRYVRRLRDATDPKCALEETCFYSAENPFHDEIGDAVLAAHIVQCADVGMIQAGNGFCFTLETLFANRVTRKLLRQNLDGHGAVEPRIACAIHLSHSARAERSADLIGPKFGAWCQIHN